MKPKKPSKAALHEVERSYEESTREAWSGFQRTLEKLDARYAPRAIEILEGRNRRVYVMRNYVVKVPRNGDGIADNDWEGSVSNCEQYPQSDYQVQYARTRMFVVSDVPIVLMERVTEATSKEIVLRLRREPQWTWSVDGGQVGFNKRGRLVAYDYGCR